MSFVMITDHGIAPRDPMMPYEQVGPGLYEGEYVADVEGVGQVAVSVARKREPNGAGMVFRGWARLINEDGSTMLDVDNQEMELEFAYPADPGFIVAKAVKDGDTVVKSGEDVIATELIRIMLGEPQTMVDVPVDEGQDPQQIGLLMLDPTVCLNISIKHAKGLADEATPLVDLGSLLTP